MIGSNEEKKSDGSTREGKVRKTKAGFEPYQVRKKVSVVQDEQHNKGTPGERSRTSSRSSTSGDRRHSSSASDRRSNSQGDHKQASPGDRASNKKHHGHKNRKQDRNYQKKNADSDCSSPKSPNHTPMKNHIPKEKDPNSRQSSTGKTTNDNLVQRNEQNGEKEDSRKHKQKVLGHSLLECPCACALPEGCDGCSPNPKSTNPVKPESDQNQDQLNIEQGVIDTKFLVASPVTVHKERSVLESESEGECGYSDTMEHFDNIVNQSPSNQSPSKPMTHDEINALFTNAAGKAVPQVTIHENSLVEKLNESTNEIDKDSTGSMTHISISSSSEPSNSRKSSLENEKDSDSSVPRKQHTKPQNEIKQKQPRQRNVLNNIVTILNENKNLDNNTRQKTQGSNQKGSRKSEENRDKNQNYKSRNDRRNSRKQQTKMESRRTSNQKSNDRGKSDQVKHEENDSQPKDTQKRGGVISLPDPNYISNSVEEKNRDSHATPSPSIKHVHFSAEGLEFFFIIIILMQF